jgi:hypothetical protein
MNIELNIEQLVLDGLSLSTLQGVALKLSVETELTQLLRECGLKGMSEKAIPRLTVDSLQLAAGGRPHEWGRQIARNLYAGLAALSSSSRQETNFSSNFSSRGNATQSARPSPQTQSPAHSTHEKIKS